MARIDITEYACCTKDVPEGSAELDQKQGPVCFRNAAFCDDIANDCLAVGMPFCQGCEVDTNSCHELGSYQLHTLDLRYHLLGPSLPLVRGDSPGLGRHTH